MYSWLHYSYIQASLLLQYSGQGLILYGNQGIGKKKLALALAKNLMCKTPNLENITYNNTKKADIYTHCNTCQSCHLFDIQDHPDFYLLDLGLGSSLNTNLNNAAAIAIASAGMANENQEGKLSLSIGIDAVQNIIQRVQNTPNIAKRIVIVINGIETLTTAASNALLKTLEEPNINVHFILISNHINQVLPTILSRCMHLHVHKPNQQEAQNYLEYYVEHNKHQYQYPRNIHSLYKYQPLKIEAHLQDVYEHVLNFLINPQKNELNIDIKKQTHMQFFLAIVYYWLFDLVNCVLHKNTPRYFDIDTMMSLKLSTSKTVNVHVIFDCWKQINEFNHNKNFAINPKVILAIFVHKYQSIWA